jgi:hypothetical protein
MQCDESIPSLMRVVYSHYTIRCSKQVPGFESSINAGINEHLLSKEMTPYMLCNSFPNLYCWASGMESRHILVNEAFRTVEYNDPDSLADLKSK